MDAIPEIPLAARYTGVGDAPPDWDSISRDILCPLCDYNLRGLSEPRCPECGYRFAWPHLLFPERWQHPFLFEHQPRRNTWSFVRTFSTSFFPRKFWSVLNASHPPRPSRLFLYWIGASVLVAIAVVLLVVELFLRARSTWAIDRYVLTLISTCAICLAWPFLTFATLMIFRASMRRAKVRSIHVARCVVYGCNAAVWIGLLLTAFSLLLGEIDGFADFMTRTAIFCIAMAAVNLYHLGCAYRQYLKFDHPWAAVAATQIIVGLIFCVLAVNVTTLLLR